MTPSAQKLLDELRSDVDELGYVDGSQQDYRGRIGASDVHGLLIELKDHGLVDWGNTHISPAGDGFRAKLTGLWPLHERVLRHLKTLGPGPFQVVYADLAVVVGCRPGDAHEAVLNLADAMKIKVSSQGDRAEVEIR